MKRKKLSALLGCILALAVLTGLIVPMASRAATFELKVLNPKAPLEQYANMPLTDRAALKNKLETGQDVYILALWYEKFSNTEIVIGAAELLQEKWAREYPTARVFVVRANGYSYTTGMQGYALNPLIAGTGTAQWGGYWKRYNATSQQFMNRATAYLWNATTNTRTTTTLNDPAPPILGTPWGAKTGFEYGGGRQDGFSFNEYPFERYDLYAKYDAVILGVADCNVCTWWSSYHAKVIESFGTPCVVMTCENYENTQFYGAQDNGFSRNRRAVIDNALYCAMQAYSGGNATRYDTPTTANMSSYKVTMAKPSVSIDLTSRTARASAGVTERDRYYMDEDIWLAASKQFIEQLDWGLIYPLSQDDINPALVKPHAMGDISFVSGVNPNGTYKVENTVQQYLTFTGTSYADCVQKFNIAANDLLFTDGLPLIPPTQELVDEMLAQVNRAPGDVIGKMKMRGGTMTVQNVAVNAVMCGVKPNAFPVVLAGAEALGDSWEDDTMFWHPMTTRSGGQSMFVFVSGPITRQIGMEEDMGYNASGNQVNNAISRTLRMLFRNIAHNLTPDIDTQWGYGRPNDYLFEVIIEDLDALRTLNWKTHAEIMGYNASQSVVTIASSTNTRGMTYDTNGNSYAFKSVSTSDNWTSNTSGATSIVTYPAAYALQLKASNTTTCATKEAFMATLNTNSNITQYNVNTLGRMCWPFVTKDGIGGYDVSGSYYNAGNNQTRLVRLKGETDVPTAPRNLQLSVDAAALSATLSWDEPATDNGSAIRKYQVYCFDGGQETAFSWIDVPGGAAARSYTFTNLEAGAQYFFKVRAVNSLDNAKYLLNSANNSHVNVLTPGRLYTADFDKRAGKGGWAIYEFYTPTIPIPGRIHAPLASTYRAVPGYFNTAAKSWRDIYADKTDTTAVPNGWAPTRSNYSTWLGPTQPVS